MFIWFIHAWSTTSALPSTQLSKHMLGIYEGMAVYVLVISSLAPASGPPATFASGILCCSSGFSFPRWTPHTHAGAMSNWTIQPWISGICAHIVTNKLFEGVMMSLMSALEMRRRNHTALASFMSPVLFLFCYSVERWIWILNIECWWVPEGRHSPWCSKSQPLNMSSHQEKTNNTAHMTSKFQELGTRTGRDQQTESKCSWIPWKIPASEKRLSWAALKYIYWSWAGTGPVRSGVVPTARIGRVESGSPLS